MHLWIALALAQDCPYEGLPEREAAERAELDEALASRLREHRHEALESLKSSFLPGEIPAEQRAELQLRLAELYLEEGIDRHALGQDPAPSFERSLKLSSLVLDQPAGPHAWRAQEPAARALAWLGRTDEACAAHALREQDTED